MKERSLKVYLHSHLIGRLFQDKGGQLLFTYDKEWLHSFQAFPLSCSLPLQKDPFSQKECRAFFAGLLPEESNRLDIAQILGVSGRNDYSLLELIGGECAGAVTFIPEDGHFPEEDYRYRSLDHKALYGLLKSLPARPLLVGEPDLRLSLAGVQGKMALYVDPEGNFSLPLGGAPSTHILKPAPSRFSNLVINEAFCLHLAREIGIPAVKAERGIAHDIEYLLVKRYDRYEISENFFPKRLHQEDFCQALGIVPERKYQNEGGPSLKDIFLLVRSISGLPAVDLQNLLKTVFFNLLIGNHDAHGKNFSFLYEKLGTSIRVRLAPAYDLLSTAFYPELTPKMAMKLGNTYEPSKISLKDIEIFSAQAGLTFSAVRKSFLKTIQDVEKKLPVVGPLFPKVSDLPFLIKKNCHKMTKILSV